MLTECVAPHFTPRVNPITPAWSFTRRSKVARSVEFGKDTWQTVKRPRLVTSTIEEEFKKAQSRIESLCNSILPGCPNIVVRNAALEALNAFRKVEVLPSTINPTGDESLLFEFVRSEDTYALDFYNSGEVVLIVRKQGEILVATEFAQDGLNKAISSILIAYGKLPM